MIRLLADENIDGRLVRGLQKHYPEIDLVRVQDTDAFEQEDDVVLEIAAREGRVLVTHDLATMPRYAMDRVASGQPMPGVLIVAPGGRIATMIFEVALFAICAEENETRDRVIYLRLSE